MNNSRIDMGIGQLGNPETTFVRKFRWTLAADNLSPEWLRNVKFDHVNKTIYFEAYEVYVNGTIPILDYLAKPSSKLTFITYDGCGAALYETIFDKVRIVARTSEFDYNSSDISIQCVTLKYKKSTTQIAINTTPEPVKSDKIVLADVETEEIKINHLNVTSYLPGKTTIGKIHLTAEELHLEELLNNANNQYSDSK